MKTNEFSELQEQTHQKISSLPEGAYEFELRLQVLALQLLAEGKPVAPETLANVWQMPVAQVKAILEQASALGTLQLGDEGKLVGTAISLLPTNHALLLNGKKLYAWCAYDAIYAPAVIGQNAVVTSTDPLSGERVRLKVSPGGVLETEPRELAITYVGMDTDVSGGPESARCTQMHFFSSQENAEQWVATHPGLSILSPDQMFELVKEFQVEPARRMGLLLF